jgi:phosphate starvation-inducible PhoH-like protein
MQMKMFLTRMGEGARMVVTGDPTQVDLPPGQASGLHEALRILEGVDGIAVARFAESDVVRHPLVARIVAAYGRADANAAYGRADAKLAYGRADAATPRSREGGRGRAGPERDGTEK